MILLENPMSFQKSEFCSSTFRCHEHKFFIKKFPSHTDGLQNFKEIKFGICLTTQYDILKNHLKYLLLLLFP